MVINKSLNYFPISSLIQFFFQYINSSFRFIPAVNVDGYLHLKNLINDPQKRENVRKNFNRTECQIPLLGGVDLNRNYDEHFGLDEGGSTR